MTGHEFLSGYPAKLMEYGLAVGYLPGRGAVDAGCDADMVRTLNTHLKALFATK